MTPVLQQRVGGYSLVLAWIFFYSCGQGQLYLWWVLFSLVLVYKILYSCGVRFVSISSRGAPFYM